MCKPMLHEAGCACGAHQPGGNDQARNESAATCRPTPWKPRAAYTGFGWGRFPNPTARQQKRSAGLTGPKPPPLIDSPVHTPTSTNDHKQRPAGILLGKGPTSRAPISMLFTQSGVASCLHHGPSASDDRPATCRSTGQTRSASNSYQGTQSAWRLLSRPSTAPQQRLGRRGPRIIHQQQLVFFCAAPRLVGRAPHAFRRAGLDTGSNTHPNPTHSLALLDEAGVTGTRYRAWLMRALRSEYLSWMMRSPVSSMVLIWEQVSLARWRRWPREGGREEGVCCRAPCIKLNLCGPPA